MKFEWSEWWDYTIIGFFLGVGFMIPFGIAQLLRNAGAWLVQ